MELLPLSWIVLGVLLVLSIGMLVYFQTTAIQERAVLRFSTQVGLPLVSDAVSVAVRWHVRVRGSAMFGGGLIGLVVSAVVLFTNPSLGSAAFIWLVVSPAILTGMAISDVVTSLRSSLFRQRDGTPRIARPTATTQRDYVTAWRLRLGPACELAAGILCVFGIALGAAGRIDARAFLTGPAFPFLALSLAVWLASAGAQRRILRQRQPVADTLELAWDDAFRGETLRSLRMFQTLVGWLAVAAAALGILQAFDALTGSQTGTNWGLQLFTWGWLAIIVIFENGRARTQFRARLWPDLSAIAEDRTTPVSRPSGE
jgi:hypothetical protein